MAGYIGRSMSVNAAKAYEAGEKPKSKWTKAAMVAELSDWCEDEDRVLEDGAASLTKAELFSRFFRASSWHHTDMFYSETDFFALNEDEARQASRPMTDEELAARSAERKAESDMLRAQMEKADAARATRGAYISSHGFAPDTVAALMAERPECCEIRTSKKSGKQVIDWAGPMTSGTTPFEHAAYTRVIGFDATEGK